MYMYSMIIVFLLLYSSYYSTTIFCELGISPFTSALIVGTALFGGTITLIFTVDKVCMY